MPVNITSKTRNELKGYFLRGARPTAAQFGELIDAVVNAKDDGVSKSGNGPLQVQAESGANTLQRVIEFYKSFTDANPVWTAQLKGSGTDDGFLIKTGNQAAFFISEKTQNVGIGMDGPKHKLDVQGNIGGGAVFFTDANRTYTGVGDALGMAAIENAKNYNALMILGRRIADAGADQRRVVKLWDYLEVNTHFTSATETAGLRVNGGAIMPAPGNSERAGILFPPDAFTGGGDRASIRWYARSGEATTLEIRNDNDGDDHISLMGAGNVGIATLTPVFKLDVNGSIGAGNSDIYFTNISHNHTGIGNTAGYAALENAKNYDALMILGRAGTPNGRKVELWDYLRVNGVFVNNSDIRGKEDVEDLKYGLREVNKLRPVAFNWKAIPNQHKTLGLIAQEVNSVISEAVYIEEDRPDSPGWSISYISLIPILVNAIKELDHKLENLLTGEKS